METHEIICDFCNKRSPANASVCNILVLQASDGKDWLGSGQFHFCDEKCLRDSLHEHYYKPEKQQKVYKIKRTQRKHYKT